MRIRAILLAVTVVSGLVIGSTPAVSAGQSKKAADSRPPDVPRELTTAGHPEAGEHIPWHAIAAGGGAPASTSHSIGSSVGQSAAGKSVSASHTMLHGFWQDFSLRGPCCTRRRGDVDKDGVYPEEIDSTDLGTLVNFLFSPDGTVELPCPEEADVDGLGGPYPIDSSDLGTLVNFLFSAPGTVVLPDCP
jgi:hypothetical protein